MKIGIVEVIYGPMFAGKSSELIRQVKRCKIAGIKFQVFKPIIDNRYVAEKICNHDGENIDVCIVENSKSILEKLNMETEKVFIDEAQFFDMDLARIVNTITKGLGIDVIIAGLSRDHNDKAFGPMELLMGMAQVTKSLSAICTFEENGKICGDKAYFTERLIEGPQVMVGGKDLYCVRCKNHTKTPPPYGHLPLTGENLLSEKTQDQQCAEQSTMNLSRSAQLP